MLEEVGNEVWHLGPFDSYLGHNNDFAGHRWLLLWFSRGGSDGSSRYVSFYGYGKVCSGVPSSSSGLDLFLDEQERS